MLSVKWWPFCLGLDMLTSIVNEGWRTAFANLVYCTTVSTSPCLKKAECFLNKRGVGWVSILVYCVNITLAYMHCVIVLLWLGTMFCWYRDDNLHLDRVQSGAEVFHEQTHIWLKDRSPISMLQLLASWCWNMPVRPQNCQQMTIIKISCLMFSNENMSIDIKINTRNRKCLEYVYVKLEY